jgi:hypothetical protein
MEGQIFFFFGDEFLHCYLHPRKRKYFISNAWILLPKSCTKNLKGILVFEEMLALFWLPS